MTRLRCYKSQNYGYKLQDVLCCQITIGDADSGNPMVVKELDKYRMNSDAMLSDLKRWQADSTTMAVDVKSLRLSIDEYERYCA